MRTGRYTLPGWICGVFFLFLLLWTVNELLVIYSVQHECRKNIDSAVRTLVNKSVASGSGSGSSAKAEEKLAADFLNTARDDLNTLGRKTYLLVYVFILGCVSILFVFLAWVYAIRNRELTVRLENILSRKEEIDELGLAAAGLAHETKNPLGVIRGLAQNIADNSANPPETREKAREIMEETDITTARLGDFLSYARFRSPVPGEINIVEFIERICNLVSDDFRNSGVELDSEITPCRVNADQDMLSQILMNLLTNSLKFTDKGGRVTIAFDVGKNGTAGLKVTDTGSGIDPELLPNIFKPYVTKSTGGYGIGLAVVKRIVEQAGWKIGVSSQPGRGTEISISGIQVQD